MVYLENLRKTRRCLCEKFTEGGEFSQTKVAEVCGSNPNTPRKHLPILQNQIICEEKKLVKVEGRNRWTLVVPDDEFESPPPLTSEEVEACRDVLGDLAMKFELLRRFEALKSEHD